MNTNLRQLLMLVKAQADAGFLLHQGLTFRKFQHCLLRLRMQITLFMMTRGFALLISAKEL